MLELELQSNCLPSSLLISLLYTNDTAPSRKRTQGSQSPVQLQRTRSRNAQRTTRAKSQHRVKHTRRGTHERTHRRSARPRGPSTSCSRQSTGFLQATASRQRLTCGTCAFNLLQEQCILPVLIIRRDSLKTSSMVQSSSR